MKKIFLFAILFGTLSNAKSQVYIQGGANFSNITKTKSGETQENKLLPTFNAGVLGRLGLSTPVDLETGVLIEGRGAKSNTYFTDSRSDNYVKSKFNPLYVVVPLNVVFRFPFQKQNNIFINAGPYAEVGVAGKSKTDAKVFGVSSSSSDNIKFSNNNPFTSNQDDAAYNKLKRFGFGVNVGGGLDLGAILLKVNYEYGLTKINSTESNNSANDKNKYRTFSISIGIPLGRS